MDSGFWEENTRHCWLYESEFGVAVPKQGQVLILFYRPKIPRYEAFNNAIKLLIE
jgi:hypothetical protein